MFRNIHRGTKSTHLVETWLMWEGQQWYLNCLNRGLFELCTDTYTKDYTVQLLISLFCSRGYQQELTCLFTMLEQMLTRVSRNWEQCVDGGCWESIHFTWKSVVVQMNFDHAWLTYSYDCCVTSWSFVPSSNSIRMQVGTSGFVVIIPNFKGCKHFHHYLLVVSCGEGKFMKSGNASICSGNLNDSNSSGDPHYQK